MTVLFADLQEFSSLAEQMAPNDLLAQLSVYFETVSQAIAEEHGTVDKFIGDGIMAFWGARAHRDDHVLRACCGALKAARRMQQLNAEWEAEGRPPLRLRIGLHCANVLVGNVGSSARLSYTVMGDGVNVAARLEGLNKAFGTTICVSDSVFNAVASKVVARPLRRVHVKGRRQKLERPQPDQKPSANESHRPGQNRTLRVPDARKHNHRQRSVPQGLPALAD